MKYFILQTAKDYDLPIYIVQRLYKKSNYNNSLFYEFLEEEIKIRRRKGVK